MPQKLTNKQFIEKAKKIHSDKYDYSLVNYINNRTKIKIICPIHSIFEQNPNNHLNRQGCKKCSFENQSKRQLYNNDIFIKKSKLTHSDKYNYILVNYKGFYHKVNIICKKHGIFSQLPSDHIRGIGCPNCNESKGEREIRCLLEQNNVDFETQKTFKNCRNINPLPFDFYLPKNNILIEFDGEQHFISKECFGGEKGFNKTQKNDQIKNKYCEKHNIKLFRISYQDNILEKLENIFLKK